MRDAVEAFIAGWESVAKSLPDAAIIADCARAQWTPLEACVDGIEKAFRWVHEKNLAKLGYVRIPGATGTKPAKGGGNLVLARKGSELRGKAEKQVYAKKGDFGSGKKADAKPAEKPATGVASEKSTPTSDQIHGALNKRNKKGWLHSHDKESGRKILESLGPTRVYDRPGYVNFVFESPSETTHVTWRDVETKRGADGKIVSPMEKWSIMRTAVASTEKKPEAVESAPKPAEKTATEKGEAKEPWEMTRVDVAIGSHESLGIDWVLGRMKAATGQKKESLKKEYANLQSIKQKAVDDHRAAVAAALDAGKPVPAEVLAEYPDLVKKHGNGANL